MATRTPIAVLSSPVTPGSPPHVRAVMKKLAKAIENLEEPAVEKIAEEEQENPFHVLISTMLSSRSERSSSLDPHRAQKPRPS